MTRPIEWSKYGATLWIVSVVTIVTSPVYADKWTGKDKVLHIAASSGLTIGSYGLLRAYSGYNMGRRTAIAGAVGLGAGLLKEGLDMIFNTGEPSYKDLTMDVIGTATGLIFIVIFDVLLGTDTKGR